MLLNQSNIFVDCTAAYNQKSSSHNSEYLESVPQVSTKNGEESLHRKLQKSVHRLTFSQLVMEQ